MPVFRPDTLRRISEEIFIAYGAPPEEARLVSEFLIKANLCGHDSHGVIPVSYTHLTLPTILLV